MDVCVRIYVVYVVVALICLTSINKCFPVDSKWFYPRLLRSCCSFRDIKSHVDFWVSSRTGIHSATFFSTRLVRKMPHTQYSSAKPQGETVHASAGLPNEAIGS